MATWQRTEAAEGRVGSAGHQIPHDSLSKQGQTGSTRHKQGPNKVAPPSTIPVLEAPQRSVTLT